MMVEKIWEDRRRVLGLPLSFTRYSMSEDRLFLNTGMLNLREEDLLLYRVRDISLTRSLGQRLFGVGTVTVISSDATHPQLELKNIGNPAEVKELLSEKVEAAKLNRKIRATELLDTPEEDDGEEEEEDD